ncbi:hypothetical protein GCM10009678_52290 [Actinomadura kijaniata]|uniref:Uncharacterized protein n=1 Tax=Actinomadura namibiensis TaxID=182080 RepID=A0A7W3LQ97_ACTNM|nr:pyridoxamine 5'-phosphate oxidase family protein [Actinomadura namibiensis]MBA8952371.1 hypothetical protein [Actinomadura namibiensis]
MSGTEVGFQGPDLSFGSTLNAVKARGLRRDGRRAIHAHPAKDGDAKVAGIAVEVTDPEEGRRHTTGGEPPGGFPAFRLDPREAVPTGVEGNETVIRPWRPGRPVETFRRT